MQIHELRALTMYMSSCGATKGESIQEFFCERDTESFLIEYGRGRSIDRQIFVLNFMWSLVESTDKIAKAGSKERKEMAEAVSRYVVVNRRLRDAINLRFQQLRQ